MDIYREELMEHYKNPQNRGRLAAPSVTSVGKNAMCGDFLTLDLEIRDNKIVDVSYDGEACAVSIASASVLSEEILGKNLVEVKDFSKEKLLALLGVNLTTSRIKCATLILEALDSALEAYEKNN